MLLNVIVVLFALMSPLSTLFMYHFSQIFLRSSDDNVINEKIGFKLTLHNSSSDWSSPLCRTGRTHQLRVHCLHVGHPVVGDYTYSDRTDTTPSRMMLHALRLRIPMKRETVDVVAPDPLTPESDALWRPVDTFETYEGYLEKEGLEEGFRLSDGCSVKVDVKTEKADRVSTL